MTTPRSDREPLLDVMHRTLRDERETCHAAALWLVDAEDRIMASSGGVSAAAEMLPTIRLTAIGLMDGLQQPERGVVIAGEDQGFVAQRLPGRYREWMLIAHITTDALSGLPGGDLLPPVTAVVRSLARHLGQWLPAAAQNKLARRNPDPLDLAQAMYTVSSAITALHIVDGDGLPIQSRTRFAVEEDADSPAVVDRLDLLDRSGRLAQLGPVLELNWIEPGRAHILMYVSDPLVVLHLQMEPATALSQIRGIIDFLMPNRHDGPTAAWLRDRGCADPTLTCWGIDAAPPNGERLLRSRHGRLFHRPACSQAVAIAPVNRRWLPTRLEGIDRGLRPCRSCSA